MFVPALSTNIPAPMTTEPSETLSATEAQRAKKQAEREALLAEHNALQSVLESAKASSTGIADGKVVGPAEGHTYQGPVQVVAGVSEPGAMPRVRISSAMSSVVAESATARWREQRNAMIKSAAGVQCAHECPQHALLDRTIIR